MKSILTLFTLCVLGLSSLRLETLDQMELQQSRVSRSESALIPVDSSLAGISANGELKRPEVGRDGHLAGKGHVLVFVIHRASAVQDVAFWNRVIELVNRSHPGSGMTIQYWGVCDEAAECNAYQAAAKFVILGYLDSYEMRVVAKADAAGQSLLYDDSQRLVARLVLASDPVGQTTDLLEKAK